MLEKIKNWFKNYWYYYKWTAIIAAFFIGVIVFCIVNSTGTNDYDIQIFYTGPYFETNGVEAEMEEAIASLMDDYNGDGKKKADIIIMTAFTDEQIVAALGDNDTPTERIKYSQYTVKNIESGFTQQAFAGDGIICLLDEFWYNRLLENGGLAKISEVLGYTPDNLRDEYSINMRDIHFFEYYEVFKSLPENTILCFRTMPTAAAFTGRKQCENNYEYSRKYLKALLSF